MTTNKLTRNLTPVQKKHINTLFWRAGYCNTSWNHALGAGLAFFFSMRPVLDDLYKDNPEEKAAAYERQIEYFNTNYCLFGFVLGVVYAMEEQRATKGDVSGEAISAIRVALGGPLAAIGDTLTQSVIKIIIASMVLGMAQEGNIVAPILFLALYCGILFSLDRVATYLGYTAGTSLIDKLFEGGLIESFTKAVGALGLFVVGALSASAVKVNFNVVLGATNLQAALDGILPGLVPLILTLCVMTLIKKKVSVNKIIWGLFALCFLFAAVGII